MFTLDRDQHCGRIHILPHLTQRAVITLTLPSLCLPLLMMIAMALASTLLAEDASAQFVDATSGPLGNTGSGRGVAWGDFDNDGDLDLYLANHNSANKLFRNEGAGVFVDATGDPMGDDGTGFGVAWGDYDNDGDLDLYLSNFNLANNLFRNDGDGIFVDVTSGPLGDTGSGQGVAWADYDGDGDLDLYLINTGQANKLFRNEGGGTFADATSAPLDDAGSGSSLAWGDYDNDGDPDLYLALFPNDKLLRNEGGGAFVDVTSSPLNDTGNAKGVDWGDYDNDGDLDLYRSNFNSANNLFRNDGGDTFVDVTSGPLGGPTTSLGVAWADYDNDSDLDLYLANFGANMLFRNDGGGTFVDATSAPLDNSSNGIGVAWADIDSDGDLDLYLSISGSANKLFRNDLVSANHWLQVKLVGTVSNRSAIGARVRIMTGGTTQIREVSGGSGHLSQNSLPVEFGLGAATVIDSLIIRWPSGIVQNVSPPPAVDSSIEVVEQPDVLEVQVLSPNGGELLTPGSGELIEWSAKLSGGVSVIAITVDIHFVPDLTLYGSTTFGPGSASSLRSIDPNTGSSTHIDGIGFNRVGAVAMNPLTGALYASAERFAGDVPVLITIDRATGLGREIGPTGVAANITDLAFDRETNTLYGHRPTAMANTLTNIYTFNLASGAATSVGGTSQIGTGGGLEFSLPNHLRLTLADKMFEVNRLTGGATSPVPLVFSAPVENNTRIKGLSIHPVSGLYFALAHDADNDLQLTRINPGTGTVTNIGATANGMDGLAFGPGSRVTIATGEANDGSYLWTVPDMATNAGKIEIVAHVAAGDSASDMSDGYVNIIPLTDAEEGRPQRADFLAAAVPNPFYGSTMIRFGLSKPGPARVVIYDARGRLVRELLSDRLPAGESSVIWDSRDQGGTQVATGTYFVRLEIGGKVLNRRISYLR